MPPTPYRRLRRLLWKGAGPLAYVALLGLSFAVFISSMHSCSEPTDAPGPTGVQIVTEKR